MKKTDGTLSNKLKKLFTAMLKGNRFKKRGKTLSDFLNEIAERYGEADVYRWYVGEKLCRKSYIELTEDSRRIASYLTHRFGRETHIALLGETSYEWITAYLGIMTGSCVSVPMDAKLDVESIAARLIKADVSVLLLSDRFSYHCDRLHHLCPDLVIISMRDLLSFAEDHDPSFVTDIDENALAQIMFTSGTTGTGKGVMLSHRNIMYVTHGNMRLCEPGERLLSVLPIHHCFELFYTQLSHMLHGAVICVNDGLENIIPNMHRFGIQIIITVPMLANRFAAMITRKEDEQTPEQLREMFGGHLKLLGMGGAAVRPDVIATMHRIGVNVFSGYGLTEGTGGCIIKPIDSDKYDSIGLPIVDGLKVKIIDGEICLNGPTVMLGYYKDQQATDEVLIDGWLHTRDLGYMDDEGYVYINGRKNNMIVTSNGENVYPEELEEYIKEIPGVIEAVVYKRDNHLAAGIQIADMPNQQFVREEISKINKRIPSYKAIAMLSFQTNPFPLTTSMKVRRKEAVKVLLQQSPAAEKKNSMSSTVGNNDILNLICSVFASALNRCDFFPDTNFFDEGGDSLAAIEAAAELSKTFTTITPNDIYINPTPQLLYLCLCGETENSEQIKIADINAMIAVRTPMTPGLGNILLTGATGYLGNHILHELVEKGYAVTCLIRNHDTFVRNCNYYFPDYDFSSVKVIKGDICAENLGLTESEYRELAAWANSVIHTAADVRHSAFESELQKTNVHGTENVISFCVDAGAKLYHTSSFSVAGFRTDATLYENVLDIGQQISQNIYIKSKYQAEEKVLLARKKGIQTSIMRMGFLTWRKDGIFQINESSNGLAAQLRAFRKLRMYPSELAELSYDFSAVDESAKAFVLLAESSSEDCIWHVLNPNRITLSELNLGNEVSNEVFLQNVVQNNTDRDVIILSMYLQMIRSGINENVDLSTTVQALRNLGFEWSMPNPILPI